jgi:hypothetical protein
MRSLVVAVFAAALLSSPYAMALNPQPEPPGKSKIKRVYSGKDDSRKKNLKPGKTRTQGTPVAPTKY